MDADGSNPINLTSGSDLELGPAWSPDGSQIAFHSWRGAWDVYLISADGSGLVNLSENTADDSWPAWSPDGDRIAFTSNRTGEREIYLMGQDGSDPVNLTEHLAEDVWPAWSPEIPASNFAPEFGIVINSTLLRLTEGKGRQGVDLQRPEWQVVEIPLDELDLAGPVESIRFTGRLSGRFYLDEIRLVSAADEGATAVLEHHDELPTAHTLEQNFPNPFNGETVIRFALSHRNNVELALYNLAGQRVATLVDGLKAAGSHAVRWRGRDDEGRFVASGIYFYRLRLGESVKTRTAGEVVARPRPDVGSRAMFAKVLAIVARVAASLLLGVCAWRGSDVTTEVGANGVTNG